MGFFVRDIAEIGDRKIGARVSLFPRNSRRRSIDRSFDHSGDRLLCGLRKIYFLSVVCIEIESAPQNNATICLIINYNPYEHVHNAAAIVSYVGACLTPIATEYKKETKI